MKTSLSFFLKVKSTLMANAVLMLFRSIYLLQVTVDCNSDYLVIFRGKSKHTSLISPFHKWILPESELKHCYGEKFSDDYNFDEDLIPIGKGQTFRRLSHKHCPEGAYNQEDDNTVHNDREALVKNILNGGDSEMKSDISNLQSPPFLLDNDSSDDNYDKTTTKKYRRFKSEESLISASQKCILLHGLYEIWSEGQSVDEVVMKVEHTIQYQILLQKYNSNNEKNDINNDIKTVGQIIENNNSEVDKNISNLISIRIAASVLEQPWLSTHELKSTILDKFEHLWVNLDPNFNKKNEFNLNNLSNTTVDETEAVVGTTIVAGTKVSLGAMNSLETNDSIYTNDGIYYNDKTKDSLETIKPSTEEFAENEEPSENKNLDRNRVSDRGTSLGLELDMRVYVDEVTGYCVLCRQLARGLAAPLNSGEGDRDALPLTGSLRRPLSGVLKTFALKSLPLRTPTAMEPELAFLMVIIIAIDDDNDDDYYYIDDCDDDDDNTKNDDDDDDDGRNLHHGNNDDNKTSNDDNDNGDGNI
jgi:hypothetical protein